jgi:ABC-type bacteriocin/lantibiotic exporter with double-glycine peptidase domain
LKDVFRSNYVLADDTREHLLDVDGGLAGGPKIRVRGLRRRSEATGQEILRGVDLDVPRGVVMGVIGPSGSGKSTLLRALNRLWEPAPGAVTLDGADICGIDVLTLRRKVGMLFQLPAMFDGTPFYAMMAPGIDFPKSMNLFSSLDRTFDIGMLQHFPVKSAS